MERVSLHCIQLRSFIEAAPTRLHAGHLALPFLRAQSKIAVVAHPAGDRGNTGDVLFGELDLGGGRRDVPLTHGEVGGGDGADVNSMGIDLQATRSFS